MLKMLLMLPLLIAVTNWSGVQDARLSKHDNRVHTSHPLSTLLTTFLGYIRPIISQNSANWVKNLANLNSLTPKVFLF